MHRWSVLALACMLPLMAARVHGREAWQAEILTSGDVVHQGDPALVERSGEAVSVARQVNLAFVLDASGSMNATLPAAGRTRLAVAREVMRSLVPRIPAGVHGSLWFYGDRLPQDPRSESCTDIEQVIALGAIDSEALMARIDAVSAIGYTPIAASLDQAAATLPAAPDQSNAILLVSDGEETCEGEPCALAASLRASAAAVVVHVVGYAVDDATRRQLRCITDAAGGTYADADERRLGHYRGDIRLVPGSYFLDVNGSVKRMVAIEESAFLDIALGAIEVGVRYELYRAGGERMGSFDGVTPVFPGTYSVRWQDGAVDDVVVEPGRVARPGA